MSSNLNKSELQHISGASKSDTQHDIALPRSIPVDVDSLLTVSWRREEAAYISRDLSMLPYHGSVQNKYGKL